MKKNNIDNEELFINESGLYSLVMASESPRVKEFKHWVTSEVIPQAMKEAGYVTVKDKLNFIFGGEWKEM